ncbi:MAG: hypothetical protein ACFHWZ_16935 [Phycisphaerales bacterium]
MTHSSAPDPQISVRDRVDVLLAEYGTMYALAEFRMNSLDRRVPGAGAALVAFLGGVPAVPQSTAWLLLVVIPASLIWFLRTTVNHARSFEDAIRRIEEIERQLNALVGESLLRFQSTHPSKGRAVGGRTGAETVFAVLLASFILLGASSVLATTLFNSAYSLSVFWAFLCSIAVHHAWVTFRWARYRYPAGRSK